MRSLDDTLADLARMPVPELTSLDGAVMAGLARRRQEAAAAPRLMGLAAAVALVMGMVGGVVSSSEPAVAQPISPFAPDNPLAPSTLLAVRP